MVSSLVDKGTECIAEVVESRGLIVLLEIGCVASRLRF
jgi:hypothetical protein